MDFHLSISSIIIILFLSFFLTILPPSYCDEDDPFEVCNRTYNCGGVNIPFPLWGGSRPEYCGHPGYNLSCLNNEYPVIEIEGIEFRVLNITTSSRTFTVARSDLWDGPCSVHPEFRNTTLNYTLFDYASTNQNITILYGCPPQNDDIPVRNRFNCSPEVGDGKVNAYFIDEYLPNNQVEALTRDCDNNIQVPILRTSAIALLADPQGGAPAVHQAMDKGFEVEYYSNPLGTACTACEDSGGVCGGSNSRGQFLCYCRNQRQSNNTCPIQTKVTAGIGVLMVTICCFKRKLSSSKIISFWRKESETHKSVEAFLRNNGPLAIRRYSYSDIKKMTNSFRDKLGEGGFGGVYKGKLQDGSLVAVKVLKESKGNGDEFINEVASISRTSHVNIVTLMGFCFEGSKRTLIYEFMPNGSLEKFIYKENHSKANCHLEWETIYKIALGIARGLEYLHRGCNTRILHFDIKPHNILLDENFCPKISDFGLAKICSKEESIISMLGARGTIGYVAPELVCRNIGGVSHKSDVYSYGMMVSEMVGGRKNIDIGVDRSSELFFPHWIYKRLELDEELGLKGLMNEEDQERARKMIIVSLWCIQTDPSNRPPMSKVVNMLEGSLDSLQIPPKPFFSSPPRSPADLSTTTETSQVIL
ncbi:LEAF RUST 10 DISEASE-RESISTANCE LOCUS RECEPTOR-LIKE PROTEIN KINASE-like 2.1 [Corylus avellana]|uniref:LEAF RUST 10 DISEASE-RESISTANCE LOCUS RECEPTOR-LIKE PROTEIN KINASE-like 2.1 n=1 Tax=Corylus avellana TaxID=13451 RepID=UPI00286C1B1F|nr:LEAF RUST 10 DISEASE-RESISTANCE LOCUS RECEPTOR-LIKE PROTEIN KINASE-like 2.1 [Corylus avellana]